MKILRILSQHRRDFVAEFECEHCGHVKQRCGYADRNFHDNVVPGIACSQCGLKAPEDYRPLATKYPEGVQL